MDELQLKQCMPSTAKCHTDGRRITHGTGKLIKRTAKNFRRFDFLIGTDGAVLLHGVMHRLHSGQQAWISGGFCDQTCFCMVYNLRIQGFSDALGAGYASKQGRSRDEHERAPKVDQHVVAAAGKNHLLPNVPWGLVCFEA